MRKDNSRLFKEWRCLTPIRATLHLQTMRARRLGHRNLLLWWHRRPHRISFRHRYKQLKRRSQLTLQAQLQPKGQGQGQHLPHRCLRAG